MPQKPWALCVFVAPAAHASSPIWRLGAPGDSCNQACASSGTMTCQSGHWPDGAEAVENIASRLRYSCMKTEATADPMGPAVHEFGSCTFATATVTCAAKPSQGHRRLCPCDSNELVHVVAHRGSSCSDACLRRGGVCQTAHSAWDLSIQELKAAVEKAGEQCQTTSSTALGHAPYLTTEGACVAAVGASTATCDTFDHDVRRICPCLGANEHDPSIMDPRMVHVRDEAIHGPVDRTCKNGGFRQGKWSGGLQSKLAHKFANEAECKDAVEAHCASANGVTFEPSLGECWCNHGMTGYVDEPSMRTCWFEDADPNDAPVGRLFSLDSRISSSQQTSRELPVPMVLAAIAAVFVAFGAFAWRRSSRRLEVGEGSTEILVQDQFTEE